MEIRAEKSWLCWPVALCAVLAGCAGGGQGVLVPVDERVVGGAGTDGRRGAVSTSLWDVRPAPRQGEGATDRPPAGRLASGTETPASAVAHPLTGAAVARVAPLDVDRAGGAMQALPPPAGADDIRHRHPAVIALVAEARRAERAGKLAVAAAQLERALRIDPNDAGLWHRLAALKLRQGDAEHATSFALKSNALAGEDTNLQARNATLIDAARARRRQGRAAG